MRPSSFLRSAAAGAQRKLPLPTLYPPNPVPRLKPASAEFLPSLINCPTTLPPALIPPKEVDKKEWFAQAKGLYHLGKSYYQFYKTGVKQANSNRKIRKILKNELAKAIGHIRIPGSAVVAMTRSEFQLCTRTKRDWQKMPGTAPI